MELPQRRPLVAKAEEEKELKPSKKVKEINTSCPYYYIYSDVTSNQRMKEISDILEKYELISFGDISSSKESLNAFLIDFSKDLSELVDNLSRVINTEKYPNYYNLNESTVVGSITRIIKLFQESVNYYSENKLEIFSQFTRPIYESFIVAKYLMRNGEDSQRNFRLVSYRARYDNFNKLQELDDKNHPIIKRQLMKLETKLEVDGFTIDDLIRENKKGNKAWKLDGKSFWKIHSEVDHKDLYSFIYGVGSDAVHGNWQEIFDFHLTRKGIGYFGFLNFEKCDCRVLVPLNSIVIEIIHEFLEWNESLNNEIKLGLLNMNSISNKVYEIWEREYGEILE